MSSIDSHPLTAIGSDVISDTAPCGENARYDTEFEQLEAELAKQESLTSATVDWEKVITLASGITQKNSKDILIGSYLCYALLLQEGYSGLAVGLKILNDMAETHWDCLFPPVKRMRARQTAYAWLAEKAGLILTDKIPTAGESAVVLEAAEWLKKLDHTLIEKMGDQAPLLTDLSRPLKNYQQSAKAEQERSSLPQAQPPQQQQAEATQSIPDPEEKTPVEASKPAVVKPVSRQPSTATQAISVSKLETEADCKKILRQLQTVSRDIAGFWVNQKLSDPRAYRMSRAAAWMAVENVPPSNEGITQINPPPAERLKFFETTLQNADYSNLVVELERTIARAPFWLDGHFLVVKALRALGGEYDKAVQTVIRETANFLNRLPEMLELAFSDKTPFSSDQTRMWLNAEVLITSESGNAGGMSINSGSESWDLALAEASKNAASGELEQAVAAMQQGIFQAGQQRDQMYWRSALAQLLLQSGNTDSATHLLEQLCAQLDEEKLSLWEPKLLSHSYHLLLQSYQKQSKKNKEDSGLKEKINRAYQKLCWFDPVKALSVKGG